MWTDLGVLVARVVHAPPDDLDARERLERRPRHDLHTTPEPLQLLPVSSQINVKSVPMRLDSKNIWATDVDRSVMVERCALTSLVANRARSHWKRADIEWKASQ